MEELEMEKADVPTPKSMDELTSYINGLIKQEHDYGTCVYAVSMASVAAFNYVASELGITGFQAGCADMDIIRRTRNIKGPFKLVDYADILYPQYGNKFLNQEIPSSVWEWIKEEAQKHLNEKEFCSPTVIEHWKSLVAGKVPFGMSVTTPRSDER